jgi:putative endonuclease
MTLDGQAAEDWLAAQLTAAGWQVLAQRWRVRWGELDLVLLGGGVLVFVEVKARQHWGIDAGGALAVGLSKQKKLIKAANLFLSAHPDTVYEACRFDVALICKKTTGFQLRDYLISAFEVF